MQALEQDIKAARRPRQTTAGCRREYAEQARKLCLLLGATNEELAGFFDVPPATLEDWLATVPAFAAAVQAGRDLADAEIADRLYRRALGYSHEAVRIFNHQGSPLKVPYVEHYPPDTAACIFWLKSRQRDKWRDKVEHEHHAVSELLDCLDAAGERAKNARRS